MDIIMVLLLLFGHENRRRNGQIKKTKGLFSEQIGPKWSDFISRRSGLFRRRTGLISARIKPDSWQIKPDPQRRKPVHLILIYILEDLAHYVGLLLAPAEGFGRGLFLPIGQKKTLHCFGQF